GGRVYNLILKFQVRETDGMAEAASIEIHAAHEVTGNVLVVIERVAVPESSAQDVLEVRKAKERAHVLRDLVVQTSKSVALMEFIGKRTCERLERSGDGHRYGRVLNGTLPVNEKKQLVLDNRAPKIAAVLAALEGRGKSRGCGERRRKSAIAECAEGIAEKCGAS